MAIGKKDLKYAVGSSKKTKMNTMLADYRAMYGDDGNEQSTAMIFLTN